jgi:hypothetical protein
LQQPSSKMTNVTVFLKITSRQSLVNQAVLDLIQS